MKNGKLKSNDYYKLASGLGWLSVAIMSLGALSFMASAPTIFVYAGLEGKYSREIMATAEYDTFTSEKLAEYQNAFNNGEISKEDYLQKIDDINKGNVFSEFIKERATDEQATKYNDLDNKGDTALSIMIASVPTIALSVAVSAIGESFKKKGNKLKEKEIEEESQSDIF